VASGEVASTPASGDKDKQANGFGSVKGMSGLSRFRHSSMSIKGKPKFWSANKDKQDGTAEEPSQVETPNHDTDKDGKNRFSIGRKKSTFKF
jgi:ubiquitin carboxyl-terminal hydrolase 9/13